MQEREYKRNKAVKAVIDQHQCQAVVELLSAQFLQWFVTISTSWTPLEAFWLIEHIESASVGERELRLAVQFSDESKQTMRGHTEKAVLILSSYLRFSIREYFHNDMAIWNEESDQPDSHLKW